jgi:hypothetical protein
VGWELVGHSPLHNVLHSFSSKGIGIGIGIDVRPNASPLPFLSTGGLLYMYLSSPKRVKVALVPVASLLDFFDGVPVQGTCKFGSSCTFSHSANVRPLCQFYKAGSCRYGSSCLLRHQQDSRRPLPGNGQSTTEGDEKAPGDEVGAI